MIQYIGKLGGIKYWECTECRMKWTLVEPQACSRCDCKWYLPGNVIAWILSRCGVKPKPTCACEKRKEYLNNLPKKWYHACASMAHRAALGIRNSLGCFGSKCNLHHNDGSCVDELQNAGDVDSA